MEPSTFHRIVHGVDTKIVCYGPSVDEDLEDVRLIVLLLQGNPGIVDYYYEFLSHIFRKLNHGNPRKIPVWGLNYAGHSCSASAAATHHLSDLEGQYLHKLDFLEIFIPCHVKVIGIGHSFGCQLWVEILRRVNDNNQLTKPLRNNYPEIVKCFLIHPAIHRLRSTPHGRLFTILYPLLPITLSPFMYLLSILPESVKRIIVSYYFNAENIHLQEASLPILNYRTYRQIVDLAKAELDTVWDLDVPTVRRNVEKLHFYFGSKDLWVPLEHLNGMKEQIEGLKYQICDKDMDHQFVIKDSLTMADIVNSFVLKELSTSADTDVNEE